MIMDYILHTLFIVYYILDNQEKHTRSAYSFQEKQERMSIRLPIFFTRL